MSLEGHFADWLSDEIKKIAIECFAYRKERSASQKEVEYRTRLLNSERMKKNWEVFLKEKNQAKRRNAIRTFLIQAPLILAEGQRLNEANSDRFAIQKLQDCLKALTYFKRRWAELKNLKPPTQAIASVDHTVHLIEQWIKKKKDEVESDKEDSSWLMFGADFERLENLKKKGAENFDVTYSATALAILFKDLFGKTRIIMIVDSIMAMKCISQHKREAFRLRVKAVVKKHTS